MKTVGSQTDSVFRFERLGRFPVIHGVTTRNPALHGDGDINVAGRLSREQAVENRAFWCEQIGVDSTKIVTGRQVHGNGVVVVNGSHAGSGAQHIEQAFPATDGLVTNEIGLPLMVYTADCVPLVIYDPVQHVAGIAHAGWRGTVKNVAATLVQTMHAEFGSEPRDLTASIGPSIGPCCYEVGDEVIDAWTATAVPDRWQAVSRPVDRCHLDLWQANVLELTAEGMLVENIEVAGICTQCHSERFFSRRAGNGHRGLFATIVALAPK